MKYSDETISKLEVFTREMSADPDNFWKHSSVHHIAVLLNVHRATIYKWQKEYPEFSDTIKRWEEKRNALFLELRRKDGAWIFLAKNWLGMIDEQKIEHSGEFQPVKVIISQNGDNPNRPDGNNATPAPD
jgi:hypothetical protein